MAKRCGKPTKKGKPCRLYLLGGKCPTHDVDLTARNSAVVQSFKRNHPQRFKRQRQDAGRKGWQATVTAHGIEKAAERFAAWRIEHPSEPEQWCAGILDELNFKYGREYQEGNYFIDFILDGKIAIEVNGHQSKPSFGESEPRQNAHDEKVAFLEARGWRVIVLNVLDNRERERERLVQFLF